jgi:hypothetical protein
MVEVRRATGGEVVKADHLMTIREQTIDEVGPDKAGGAGDECTHIRNLLYPDEV